MKQIFRISFILTIITAMIHIPVFAQTYDSLWKQVKEAEEKSLPKTVMDLSDKIFRKAQREQNAPQMFKAYLYKTQSQEEVTPDSIYPNFQYVEKWVKTERNAVNRAILHSMLAGMYQDYLSRHSYELRNRTELAEGEMPEDMREWTRGLFEKQVEQHAYAALTDVPTLLKTSAKDYVPFAILGNGSAFYAHDMYHLMVTRTIDNLQGLGGQQERIEQIYQEMIQTYAGMKGREEATLMTTLDYWQWKDGDNQNIYNELITKYDAYSAVMEAYLLKAQWLNANDRPAEALEVIDKALAKYPKYYRANALEELKASILQSYLSANMLKMLYPGEEAELAIDFRNQRQVEVKLFATQFTELPDGERTEAKDIQQLPLKEVQSWSFELKPEMQKVDDPVAVKNATYLQHKNTFKIQTPEKPGVYLLSVMPKGAPQLTCYRYLVVSRLKVLILNLGDGNTEVVTLDRKSGQPIGDVEVTFYRGSGTNYKEYDKVTTDADGRKVFKSSNNSFTSYVARKGDDRAMLKQSVYLRNKPNEHEMETETHVTLLTDRAIYRPGQTVYVKGIVYRQKGEETQVMEGKAYHLTLMDVNAKELISNDVTTNDFGSFNTSFVLPTATLNGTFSIRTSDGEAYKSFKVEEYKRPTFEITFEPIKEAYRLGDKVELKGHVETFSGASVQNVPLMYRISGNLWRYWNRSEDPQAADSVMIDNKGNFSIPIELKTNDQSSSLSFNVEVTVTNEAGETQTASKRIWAHKTAYSLGINLFNYIEKQPTKLTFKPTVANDAGEAQERDLHYRLFKMEKEGLASEEVKEQTPVEEGVLKGNEDHSFASWANLPSALYLMEMTVVGEENLPEDQQTKFVRTFSLYQTTDKSFGSFVDIFLNVNGRLTFNDQELATFLFGTSHKHAYVLMDVFSNDKRIETRTLQLDNEIKEYEFDYQERYGDGVTILFTFVKDDKVYSRNVMIEHKKPEKQLTMKWEVFRDKLMPGQQEEWKLVIKTPEGAPAVAEMLAYMYDASLDKIYRQYQGLYVYYNRYLASANRQQSTNSRSYWSFYWKDKNFEVPVWAWDYLDIPRMSFYQLRGQVVYESMAVAAPMGATRMMKNLNAAGVVADDAEMEEADAAPQLANAQVTADESGQISEQPEPNETETGNEGQSVRSNFAETAFFYPELRTNDKGDVVLTFTMPESLTRWNFRGISHTKDMMVGNLSGQTVTQKDFMLRPNMPRFVRMGDKVNIAAVITNLTDDLVKGTATFTLFDPITDKTIATQRQAFRAEGQGNTTVSFGFDVTEEYTLLGVRMVADGGKFSDGEQHVLPVLSNKQYITETLAMPIRGNQTREFSTVELFNHQHPSATQKKLTVEFTGNPAWYAVQALPEISEPTSDNAIAWASAFYGNSLALYIANSQPRIQQVFNRWKLEGGDKQTLLSQLEKNQDLKEIILNETPWVMDAQSETERKQRLGLLFDLNQMNNRINTDLIKLQGLQNEDGGWSWFSGMQSSFYTTTYITGLLIRLEMLMKEGKKTVDPKYNEGIYEPTSVANQMKAKGFHFIHQEMLKHYRQMVKDYGKNKLPKYLSYMEMQYLYLIAVGNMDVPQANKEAYNHFLSLVDNNLKDGDVITKAQSAIVQHKAGKLKSATDFINSLKEHMVDEDEMGAHFAFLDKPYTWAMIPVPQHVATMEALQYVGGNDELIEEMKMWLLKQKQTRGWNSSVCTVDAIYALLCRGANLLENKGDVRITFADKVMETISPTKSDTPDLGYIKEVFDDKQTVEAPVIKVEKRDEGIAWGAAYAQYFTPMTDIQQQGKELNLERRFYVERIDAQGKKTLEQIGDKAQLKVGDVVVSRMTITLDRAMDFVQLKDRPAACFEPVAQLSGYRWNGVGYYMEVEDAATNYFFDRLGKGMHVLEVRYRVQRTGTYQVGASTVQSAYAPEFASHSNGITIKIEN
ncbi:MAG: alpha-2-macroglobulin [Bacteroidaceae bacterium]|nr:alpha-2-macroglobulin [Bacteroidaceae bacterium]